MTNTSKTKIVYKLKNRDNGLFLASLRRYGEKITPYFNDVGKIFTSIEKIQSFVLDRPLLRYNLDIKKYEVTTTITTVEKQPEELTFEKMLEQKILCDKIRNSKPLEMWQQTTLEGLLRKLCLRNELDKTTFIVILQKDTGTYWIKQNKIEDARTILRGLGIKTRSFREHYGCFGLFNMEQAINAKLLLDLSTFINVEELRNE